jgi:hypothetical protein
MEWIVIVIYVLGMFITHLIIYKDGKKGIDCTAANICCAIWPIALLICCLLQVEKWVIKILGN